jgi:hypothetical protein
LSGKPDLAAREGVSAAIGDTDREIATTKRGKRIATSVDGTLTGLGGNLIIIDDPLKLGDAMSEAVRARVIEWYRSTLLSRGDDKTTRCGKLCFK